MRVVDGFWEPLHGGRPTILTFGKFDALHLGHQAIFRRVCETARRHDCDAGVVFFHPHPLRLLAPERCPTTLTPLPLKLRLLESFGFDIAIAARFDERLRETTAEDFVAHLVERFGVRGLVVGDGARFGFMARGDAAMLQSLGSRLGFDLEIVPPVPWEGKPISSDRVRRAVARGDLSEAQAQLGRRYSAYGRVVEGDKRGRTLGFPTANVDTGDQQLPPLGIYAAEAVVGDDRHGAAVSLGVRPTFGGADVVLEAYLLDFAGDLYGREIEVAFVEKLRDELRFDSVDVLLTQMRQDVTRTRAVLGI